jgi:hypothetical protein
MAPIHSAPLLQILLELKFCLLYLPAKLMQDRCTWQADLCQRCARSTVAIAMPWDESYYPRSMRNLPPVVRLKAIEIANALLAEGNDEGKCIRIAIAKAKEWARREGLDESE